jgi:hypothetical protein
MNQSGIEDAAKYVAEQIGLSMRGLASKRGAEDIYVFAIEVADDFAAVFKAVNTVGHYQRSTGGAASRWQPSQWFANGMDFEIGPLTELLEDPTYLPDPEKDKQRSKHQAEWLKVMVQGLRKAPAAGHLQWSGRPVAPSHYVTWVLTWRSTGAAVGVYSGFQAHGHRPVTEPRESGSSIRSCFAESRYWQPGRSILIFKDRGRLVTLCETSY